ncbi:hypothetical protein ACM66Z_07090 [Sulfurovum sp. ST-21]|uniref:Uncharacterized protein n=1 Tax=Sulfurovum indicum TaxID=2779528 RepID=A0A7M1S1A2_9BACT|nr:hypothetical protein [Sulfurovum indicum]QOR61217.1 hypothetical protein IMZ28_07085 [Sulfurovum indicum]
MKTDAVYSRVNEPKERKLFINGDHHDMLAVNRIKYLAMLKEFTESVDCN